MPASIDTDRKRVLLVEDDSLIAAMLADMLIDANYEVDGPYATLSDGVAALARHLPDCALIDICLRDRDALLIAEDLDLYGIPFAFCSGGYPHGRMAERFGDIAVLAKPVSSAALVRAMDRLTH